MILRISIGILLCFSVSTSFLEAGVILPRIGAVMELGRVTPEDPWEDRPSRVQWVLARLQSEGHRVWLLDRRTSAKDCEVLFLDGPAFKSTLLERSSDPVGILQSDNRKVSEEGSPEKTVEASARVLLRYSRMENRRVVTIVPDIAECFNDYAAVRALGDAVLWVAGRSADTPRVSPFPHGGRCAVIFIVHGEGYPDKIDNFQREFLTGSAALTYAVSEEALRKYPLTVKRFAESPFHEVAIHNHEFIEYSNQDQVLATHKKLQQESLDGHTPRGMVGLYLNYFDDLREALVKHQMHWFLDKDLPYPINLPAPPDAEPVIDMTESLKPYDGWWKREDAAWLWKTGLTWKRLRSEIAVCSWHDVHMATEPSSYLEFIRYVNTLPDVWQTTAEHFQAFWRDRWRTRIEILSMDDRSVTLQIYHAPAGLTLLRRRNGITFAAILGEATPGVAKLEWKPLATMAEGGESQATEVRWGLVGGVSRRNGLDTEFAVIHPGKKMLRDEPIVVRLPEELQSRIRRTLPTTCRISTSGVKGLAFTDLEVQQIPAGGTTPNSLSFRVDRFPEQSIRYFRLRFPDKEKTGPPDRWRRSFEKRPFVFATVGFAALMVAVLLLRALRSRRRFRER